MLGLLRPGLIAVCLAVSGVSAAAADAVPSEWKTDCVGRMQISLPGEAEIAAMLPKDLLVKLTSKWGSDEPYKFPDGQFASWSSSGLLTITHPTTSKEKNALDAAIEEDHKRVKAYLKEGEAATGQAFPLTDLPAAGPVRAGWRGKDFYEVFFSTDASVIRYLVSAGDEVTNNMQALADYYQILRVGLRPRPTFEVPKALGVCLQYAFIQDDGKDRRHVGITYRLKAHPDITVWLEDGSAARIGPQQNPAKFTAHAKAAFFWEQRYQNRQSFKSLWPLHFAFKPTTMAGQKGVKTFVPLLTFEWVLVS